jgi:hypothetical protein
MRSSMRCACRIYLYIVGRKSEARKTEQTRRVVKPFKVSLLAALLMWQQVDCLRTSQNPGQQTIILHSETSRSFLHREWLPAVSGRIRMGP